MIKLLVFVTIYTNFMEIRELIDPVYRRRLPTPAKVMTSPSLCILWHLILLHPCLTVCVLRMR